jgi:RNA polymerase sigma-70 factor, ECF subfamily
MSRSAEVPILSGLDSQKRRGPSPAGSTAVPLQLTPPDQLAMRNLPPPADPSDRDGNEVELMARLRWGDADAFGELMERYWERTFRYALQLQGDADRAYDVAQETFARLWEKGRVWEPSGSICGWLLRTARNLVITEQRRGKVRMRWRSMVAREPASHPRTPLQDAEREELHLAILRAVERLSPRRREVFVLFHLHHLSYREIEKILDIRHQTIANHLQAAVVELRAALAPFITTGPPAEGSLHRPRGEDSGSTG